MNEVPSVPTPAPATISPVAFSSTNILNILRSGVEPSRTSCSTFPKIPLPLSLFTDLFTRSSLKGSPSSTIISPLITASLVTLFPIISILSIENFLPSKTFILTSIPSSSNFSVTL